LKPGLKTGVGNGIFWSEIGSGFGDAGGTPPPKLPRSNPPGGTYAAYQNNVESKKENSGSSEKEETEPYIEWL